MEQSPLHERLNSALGHLTYRALGEATGTNAETVRRYMQGQAPSVEFLAAVCANYDLNARWVLTGGGPVKQSESKAHALREANPGELLGAISTSLERLTLRVDRIEVLLQMVESRVRLWTGGVGAQFDGSIAEPKDQPERGQAGPDQHSRAGRVADALPKRQREDDR